MSEELDNPWARNFKPWEEELALTYDVLDMIDVRGYVYLGDNDAWTVMRHIQDDYDTRTLPEMICAFIDNHPDYFEDDVFNYMSETDFLTYCKRRYAHFNYVENITYRIVNI